MVHLFLDLDETLVHSISVDEMTPELLKSCKTSKLIVHKTDEYYMYERPGLQEFLDFVFKTCTHVSVWSAGMKDYVLDVVKYVVLKNKKRKLQYILYSDHCQYSKRFTKCHKKLSLFKKRLKINEDMYIIDDHPDVYTCQPKHTIQISEFIIDEPGDCEVVSKDTEFKRLKPIIRRLCTKKTTQSS